MVKVESKALFYKELDGGFVRLSLRPIQFYSVSKPWKPLPCNGFFVLGCFSEMYAFLAKVSVTFQDLSDEEGSICPIIPLRQGNIAYTLLAAVPLFLKFLRFLFVIC